MKRQFREVVDLIEYNDLVNMKKDIESGAINIKKLVEQKITEHKNKHLSSCSVCANDVNPSSSNNYTLIFGPDDFKKKATFCGIDCMIYFLNRLKSIKEENKDEKNLIRKQVNKQNRV
jgi:hypothetical protein